MGKRLGKAVEYRSTTKSDSSPFNTYSKKVIQEKRTHQNLYIYIYTFTHKHFRNNTFAYAHTQTHIQFQQGFSIRTKT